MTVTLRILLLALLALPAFAQEEPDQAAIDEANRLGQLLYAYDQAAWHGTDAVMPALQRDASSIEARVSGYLVEAVPAGWRVVFGTANPDSTAFLVAYEAVLDSTYAVTGATSHDPVRSETGFLIDAMRARDAAAARFEPMVQTRHNTAVLPGPDGTLYVYMLPAQPETNAYIVGGDARYTVDIATRAIVDSRPLHSDYQVYDLRSEPGALTAGRATAHGIPVDTDVFYVLSRPASDPAVPNHYVYSDEWVFFISKQDGIAAKLTRQGFIRIYGVDIDGSLR